MLFAPRPRMQVYNMPQTDGFQTTPPICWSGVAPVMEKEPGTGTDGRYHDHHGEFHGSHDRDMQNTSIAGSGVATPTRTFTVTSGTVSDKFNTPKYGTYALFVPSAKPGDGWDVKDSAVYSTKGLTDQFIVLRRGIAPVGTSSSPTSILMGLEFAYGNSPNYRLNFNWGSPISLDYFDQAQAAWINGVDTLKGIGFTESVFAQNDSTITITARFDRSRQIASFEINDGLFLKHSKRPPALNGPLGLSTANACIPLPQNERYRWYGTNGWAQMSVFPLSHHPLNVIKSSVAYKDMTIDLSKAVVTTNSLGRQTEGEVVTTVPSVDDNGNLSLSMTVTNGDKTEPATLSDFFFYVPATWEFPSPGSGTVPTYIEPPIVHVSEASVYDEVNRIVTRNAHLVINNSSLAFSGSFGDFAAVLSGDNGYTSAVRCRGMITGGFKSYGDAASSYVSCDLYSNDVKLKQPIGQEVIVDGWCLYSAIHLALDLGQIHPQFRQSIPFWPYGPVKSSDNCPYPILPKGTGNNPKMRFMPEAECITMLLELVKDGLPDPNTGAVVPFVTGTDPMGNWFLSQFDPRNMSPTAYFTDDDPTGYRMIQDIVVIDSTEDMRTQIDLQGQDPVTGELLILHQPLPWNFQILGRQVRYFERAGRWCSPQYLAAIAESTSILASIPSQTVVIQVPYDPTINVADKVYISERRKLRRSGEFIVTHMQAHHGLADQLGHSGYQDCVMTLTCRAAENLTPY